MEDYPNDQYSDEEEYQDNYLDEQRDVWDSTGGAYPAANRPDSLFSLFRDVWRTKDSSKVANLSETELGSLGISVRDCQDLALFARQLGHKEIYRYFRKRGEIVLATSMSRKMRFAELFVTTKKLSQKGSIGSGSPSTQTEGTKWRLFGKKRGNQTAQQEA